MSLLEVSGLVTSFGSRQHVNVVDDVSLVVDAGEVVGLVGESGSGKSLLLRSLVQALPPKFAVSSGRIDFAGKDVTHLSGRELRELRGRHIGMIFQDPISALNPVLTIGAQLQETLKFTGGVRRSADRKRRAIECLDVVGVSEPDRRMHSYPHELSGGMAQRVMIALALVGEPQLLLADEPTSALDVTVQAQIMKLLDDLRKQSGMAIVLVTHDFGVVAQACNRVYVMYAGRIVESSPVAELCSNPRHPYTIGLMNSIPRMDGDRHLLAGIPGAPPDFGDMPIGCRFASRCSHVVDACRASEVNMQTFGAAHSVACGQVEQVAKQRALLAANEKAGVI
jgi:oligopeptide/dipeptide ABC transporter ATP-binding protein